jgi:hypothetical protein
VARDKILVRTSPHPWGLGRSLRASEKFILAPTSHQSLVTNHCPSNRKNRKPEMRQLIENKHSDAVLIATNRGCFQGLKSTPPTDDPMGDAVLSEGRERWNSLLRRAPWAKGHPPVLAATVPNSEFTLTPLPYLTYQNPNRNKFACFVIRRKKQPAGKMPFGCAQGKPPLSGHESRIAGHKSRTTNHESRFSLSGALALTSFWYSSASVSHSSLRFAPALLLVHEGGRG